MARRPLRLIRGSENIAVRIRTFVDVLLVGSTLALAVVIDSLVRPRNQFVSAPFAIPILISAYRFPPRGVVVTSIFVIPTAIIAAVIDLTPPVVIAFNILSTLIVAGIAFLLDQEMLRSDRRTREVQTLNTELREANQRLIVSNIEAHRLEEESAATRRRIAEILESITDAFCSLDQEWRFTYVNHEASRLLKQIFERAPGPLVGESFWDEFPEARGSRFERELRRAVAERSPVAFETRYAPNATWLEVHAYPSAAGLSLYIRDITLRKHAEEERERLLGQVEFERARFQTILGSTANAIVYVERGGQLLANAAAVLLFGHPLDPAAGESQFAGQLFHPDGRPLALAEAPSQGALAGRTTTQEELLVVQPSGRRIPVLESAAPVYGPDEEVIGAVLVFQDISALKELEQLREEWTSVIAHDLRQPVTLIVGYASLLAKTMTTSESSPERRAVEHIMVSGRNLAKMIGDLLDLSRIETRRITLQRRSVDLVPLVRDVVERLEELTRGHAVRVEIEGSIPPLSLDPGRIEQILTNLLSNAVKYGFPDTDIVVAIERHDAEVEVSVTNHGPGVSPEELPRLFARFYRTREAQAAGMTGLGLGLYIAKGLVEAHGGTIWAESIPGQTTTFHFTLPMRMLEA